MQHEITHSAPLLNDKGGLREPGYAKKLLPIYRRADIRAGKAPAGALPPETEQIAGKYHLYGR